MRKEGTGRAPGHSQNEGKSGRTKSGRFYIDFMCLEPFRVQIDQMAFQRGPEAKNLEKSDRPKSYRFYIDFICIWTLFGSRSTKWPSRGVQEGPKRVPEGIPGSLYRPLGAWVEPWRPAESPGNHFEANFKGTAPSGSSFLESETPFFQTGGQL